jgi:zinc protease
VKVLQLCAHLDAYITGTHDKGLFIIEARPAKGITMEVMEEQLWKELETLQQRHIEDSILEKLKNKNESTVAFSNMSAANKATNLAYYESLGDAQMMNEEADRIAEITAADITRVIQRFQKSNVNILRLIGSGVAFEPAEVGEGDEDDEDEKMES